MHHRFSWAAVLLSSLLLPLGGCWGSSTSRPAALPLVWIEEGIEHQGVSISLGYRGAAPDVDGVIEPVASITRDGQPFPGAMVFIALMAPGGNAKDETPVADVATLYEPPGERSVGLYTAGKLPVPTGAKSARFRIVLPQVETDYTHEVPLP